MAGLHHDEDVTADVLNFSASAMCAAAPPLVMRSVFVLVGRLNHRMDELARCVEAALWGTTGRAVEVWLLLVNVDGTAYSYARVGREMVDALGASPSEAQLLGYLKLLTGYDTASVPKPHAVRCSGKTFATVQDCVKDAEATGAFRCTEEDVWIELHEDAPLPLTLPEDEASEAPSGPAFLRRQRAARWRRGIFAFGVHEDFMQEVADATGVLHPSCGDHARISLGPVALHSSACVHAMLGFLFLPTPAYPLRVYATLAGTTRRGQREASGETSALRLRPTVDPDNGMRCVPNRGAIHFWVSVDGLTDKRVDPDAGPMKALRAATDGLKLARLAALYTLWASKSTYRAVDTKISFVLPSGAAVTYERNLLDFMPRDEDGGNAPNEKNINLALGAEGAGVVHDSWEAHLEDVTKKHTRALAMEVDLNDADVAALPDAPEVPVQNPQPRGAPLHVLLGLTWPVREGLGGLEVKLLRCRLRGVPSAADAANVALPRALVLLQSLHSLGRLKPIVAGYGTAATAAAATNVPLPPAEERWDAAQLKAHWSKLGYGDVAPIPNDTVRDQTTLCAEGRVTAVRAQGNVVFLGLRNDAGERVQVLMNLRGWPMRWIASVRKLNSGDLVTLLGVTGHSTQGRLSLFAKTLVRIEAAPHEDAGTVVVRETAELVVVSKPSEMTAHPHPTMRASERPTALCEAMRLYVPPAPAAPVVEPPRPAENGASGRPRKQKPANKLYPVHTVEKDNSGVVVFAKNSKIADVVSAEVKAGVKYFLVVAACREGDEGGLPAAGDVWTRDEPLKEVVRDRTAGKSGKTRRQAPRVPTDARTVFQCVLSVPKARAVVLCAIPLTHGTRQIRRHLALQKLFVIGDHLQGCGTLNRTFQKTYAFRGTAMHLHTLATERATFTAPAPPPLKRLLQSMPCDSRALLDPARFPFRPLDDCCVTPAPPSVAGTRGCAEASPENPRTLSLSLSPRDVTPPAAVLADKLSPPVGVETHDSSLSRLSNHTVPVGASPATAPLPLDDGTCVVGEPALSTSILKRKDTQSPRESDSARRVLIDEASNEVCTADDPRCCLREELAGALKDFRMPMSESGESDSQTPPVWPYPTPQPTPTGAKALPSQRASHESLLSDHAVHRKRRAEANCTLCGAGCSVM
eukprot:TRINITY_DN25423_c0_g1_i1.p1 TRINITY_DN25423_c0_g1~~TRINITY_DN25423_c0_g1_i1.p1  ORF type:complete len:1147 (+),score=364.71 TRINITY_DN25423_c0_g1_i1:66-3506(+)